MTAKEYLQQYRESIDRTRELTQHLDELKAECIQLQDHEGQRIELDAAVAKYMDACEASASELNRLAALRGEISGTIDAVSDAKLRALLRERYINGKKWEQIAVDMNFEYRWVLRLHGRALEAVKQAIESHI